MKRVIQVLMIVALAVVVLPVALYSMLWIWHILQTATYTMPWNVVHYNQ